MFLRVFHSFRFSDTLQCTVHRKRCVHSRQIHMGECKTNLSAKKIHILVPTQQKNEIRKYLYTVKIDILHSEKRCVCKCGRKIQNYSITYLDKNVIRTLRVSLHFINCLPTSIIIKNKYIMQVFYLTLQSIADPIHSIARQNFYMIQTQFNSLFYILCIVCIMVFNN